MNTDNDDPKDSTGFSDEPKGDQVPEAKGAADLEQREDEPLLPKTKVDNRNRDPQQQPSDNGATNDGSAAASTAYNGLKRLIQPKDCPDKLLLDLNEATIASIGDDDDKKEGCDVVTNDFMTAFYESFGKVSPVIMIMNVICCLPVVLCFCWFPQLLVLVLLSIQHFGNWVSGKSVGDKADKWEQHFMNEIDKIEKLVQEHDTTLAEIKETLGELKRVSIQLSEEHDARITDPLAAPQQPISALENNKENEPSNE